MFANDRQLAAHGEKLAAIKPSDLDAHCGCQHRYASWSVCVPAAVSLVARTVSHVAFKVDDLEFALRDEHVIIAPNCPIPGAVVAFTEVQGAPVELTSIDRTVYQEPSDSASAGGPLRGARTSAKRIRSLSRPGPASAS